MSAQVSVELRRRVASRAGARCEYCGIHSDDVLLNHEPDHIIARKHRGETHFDNLAWACFVCNRHKGSDIASIDLTTGKIVRLFNPRRDKWTEHFQLLGAQIVPLTDVGRATEFLLQLNRPDQVEVRRLLIATGRFPVRMQPE